MAKQITTQLGRVVYDRKTHFFKVRDASRIILSLIDRFDTNQFQQRPFEAFDECTELIEHVKDLLFRLAPATAIQDEMFSIFINLLSTVLPEWAINIVEWVYENVDAGQPPWYDEYIL